MDRISSVFERCRAQGRAALTVFATCGCPSPEESVELMDEIAAKGADILEIGVPFSDPMADGAVIQQSSEIALGQGTTLAKVLDAAAGLRRRHPDTGIIVFSYFNVLLQYGLERLAARLAEIGADGVLAVDLPYEEREELLPLCRAHGLHWIRLVSPATPFERMRRIVADATGYVYYVMVCGVTGVRSSLPPELAENLARLRSVSPAPVAAGFGVSSPEAAEAVGRHADGVVVGSAVMKLAVSGRPFPEVRGDVGSLISAMRRRLEAGRAGDA